MKTIEKIIQSSTTPLRQDVVWIDTSDPTAPVVRLYVNGQWELASSESAEVQHLQDEIDDIIEELAGEGGSIEDLGEIRTKALAAIAGNGITSVTSLTKEEYDALEEKDPETLYIVKNDPANGHEWVDLGYVDTIDLKTHIIYATKNIGAETEYDVGKYFAWGDTIGYYPEDGHSFSQENAPYWDADNEEYTKYNDTDGLTELKLEDDAAHVQWGGLWRTPTASDISLLTEEFGLPDVITHDNKPYFKIYDVTEEHNLLLSLSGRAWDNDFEELSTTFLMTNRLNNNDKNIHNSFYFSYYDGQCDDASSISSERYLGTTIRPVIKVENLSELDITYDIYLGESKIVDNSTEDSNMTNILWVDLVALRDSSKLVPGRYYRITDYNTTTAQVDTQPTGHQFDIIVLATDVNKLSEDAKAIMHDNSYDVTFRDGITKRCYFYPVDGDLSDVNIVDCNTLLGISGVAENGYQIDYINKKIISTVYSSGEIREPDLQYNYFQNSSLEAWTIKYCLDNDVDKFAWADNYLSPVTHQKIIVVEDSDSHDRYLYVRYPNLDSEGQLAWVFDNTSKIYIKEYVEYGREDPETTDIIYTKDENPKIGDILDMDGINVIVVEVSIGTGVIYRMVDEWNNECPYDFKNIQFKRQLTDGQYNPDGGIDTWVYTFTWINENDVVEDLSIVGSSLRNDEAQYSGIYGNVIKPVSAYSKLYPESPTKFGIALNDIVFISPYAYDGLFYGCFSNIFGDDCYNNTFGIGCNNNTFGNECQNNFFFRSCVNNIFGNVFYNNTFGIDCNDNIFGNYCNENTFGDRCNGNFFGNHCFSNRFGDDCVWNTFGNNCGSNIFGNYCSENTFGDSCNHIVFGSDLNTLKSYCKYIIVENGNGYIYLNPTGTTTDFIYYKNVKISQGVNNTETYKTITDSHVDQTYQTIYKPTGSIEEEV